MTKFNFKSPPKGVSNLAGGSAYPISDLKEHFLSNLLTQFYREPKYYGDNTEGFKKLATTLVQKDPKFLANAVIYAREVAHLRSATHYLSAILANEVSGKPYARETVKRVCQRVDDMTEILSAYLVSFKKPIPNSLKKGLGDAFKTFDEYQLAKYDRDADVKLKDILCLARPKPVNDEMSNLWKRVLDDNLKTPETWEVMLSTEGNKKEVWEKLIDDKKLGYMATLRNLRNMIKADVSNFDKVLNYITNPNAIKNSKQMPYRFLSAYKELSNVTLENPTINSLNNLSQSLLSLNDALEKSVSNLPKLQGSTLLISDNSGSMRSPVSEKSSVLLIDIATLLMAMASNFSDISITSVFATDFKIVPVNSNNSIMSKMEQFKNTKVGYSTELYKALQWLEKSNIFFDRIIIFSDMQTYGEADCEEIIKRYRKNVNPNIWVHSIDLTGYGTSAFFPKNKVNLLAGFSENILEYIALTEKGLGSLISTIEKYHFQ